jgi:hypothetical protein
MAAYRSVHGTLSFLYITLDSASDLRSPEHGSQVVIKERSVRIVMLRLYSRLSAVYLDQSTKRSMNQTPDPKPTSEPEP